MKFLRSVFAWLQRDAIILVVALGWVSVGFGMDLPLDVDEGVRLSRMGEVVDRSVSGTPLPIKYLTDEEARQLRLDVRTPLTAVQSAEIYCFIHGIDPSEAPKCNVTQCDGGAFNQGVFLVSTPSKRASLARRASEENLSTENSPTLAFKKLPPGENRSSLASSSLSVERIRTVTEGGFGSTPIKLVFKKLPSEENRSSSASFSPSVERISTVNREGLASTSTEGRRSPSAARTEGFVRWGQGEWVEVMEQATGKRIYDIFKDMLPHPTKDDTCPFYEIGEFVAHVHQRFLKKGEASPDQWRTIIHGDCHWNNIFYDPTKEPKSHGKFIDAERSAYSSKLNQSPFLDVMTFVFTPLFYWGSVNGEGKMVKWINDQGMVEKFTSCVNAMLTGYIAAYPEETREELACYLVNFLDLFLLTARELSGIDTSKNVSTNRKPTLMGVVERSFFKSSLYENMYPLCPVHKHDCINVWMAFIEAHQDCRKTEFFDVLKRQENLAALRARINHVRNNIFAGIKPLEDMPDVELEELVVTNEPVVAKQPKARGCGCACQ